MRAVWVGGFLMIAISARAQDPAPEAFRSRHATLALAIDYTTQRLSGSVTYELENWTTKPAGSISFLLNRLMDASAVDDGRGTPLRYTQDVVRFRDDAMRQVTQVRVTLPRPIPAGGRCVSTSHAAWRRAP